MSRRWACGVLLVRGRDVVIAECTERATEGEVRSVRIVGYIKISF